MSQRVLITAGAAGIGREIARAFAAQGAQLFVCDIDAQALEELGREIKGLVTHVCDLSQRPAIEEMVAKALSALGGLDVLVNNVGIAGPTTPIEDLKPEDWDLVLKVNLTAMFDVTRLCIPHLKKSPAGVIVNLSSSAGKFGFKNRSSYCASKWGVVGFTKTLALELGQFGIRANAILPGAVAGDRIQRVLDSRAKINNRSVAEETKLMMGAQSLKQFVHPREIGAYAVFLASPAGQSITGQALSIDNGLE
jgi:NAD(P)-dependent dehydrogenase (short-subunit alcohol dehydrogenase family)